MTTQTRQELPLLTDSVLQLAAERARRYVEQVGERMVAPAEKVLAALAKFHEPFPAQPSDPRDVIKLLYDVGSPASVASPGRRCLRFVLVGVVPAAVAANRISDAWAQTPG